MNEKQTDLAIIRTMDCRWWGLETQAEYGYFRWTSERADFRVLNRDITKVELWFNCHPEKCGDVVIKQGGKELVRYAPTRPNNNVISLNVESHEDFEIYSNTFVPMQIGAGTDPRNLGVMVIWFILHTPKEVALLEMNEIPLLHETPGLKEVQMKLSKGIIQEPTDYAGKPFAISKPLKHGALLYLHKPYPRLMKQLSDYKVSKSDGRIVSFSGSPGVTADIRVEEFVSPFQRKYEYANMAGAKAAEIAKEKGWDYFMWLEWDCYLGKDYWYDVLWEEMLAWPYKPIQAGTPSISAHPLSGNLEFIKQDYISSYIKANKVCLHMIQNRPVFLSVNAALGFYDTEEAYEQFVKKPLPPLSSFDVMFGVRTFEKYGEEIFKKTAWLPSLYSGWGEQDYTEEQRIEMVKSGMKVAMHQYKKNELPL